jgi:hypothetical protein
MGLKYSPATEERRSMTYEKPTITDYGDLVALTEAAAPKLVADQVLNVGDPLTSPS